MHVLMSFESDELMSSKVMSNFCSSLGLGRGSDELPNSSAHQAKIASDELFFFTYIYNWLIYYIYIIVYPKTIVTKSEPSNNNNRQQLKYSYFICNN